MPDYFDDSSWPGHTLLLCTPADKRTTRYLPENRMAETFARLPLLAIHIQHSSVCLKLLLLLHSTWYPAIAGCLLLRLTCRCVTMCMLLLPFT
jgi:hypothetical protein